MPYANKKDLYRNQIQRWINRKKDAIKYLGEKCVYCGYAGHYAAFQFHHLDPKEKEFNWSKLRLRSWNDVIKELSKCILLCANCHAIEHSGINTRN